MTRLLVALLATLTLAGCGASTYAQPKPEKLERAAEQTDALLGSLSFSEESTHNLAVVGVPDVVGVALTEQAVGTKEPFGGSATTVSKAVRRFLIEAKDRKDGTSGIVAVVEVLDPTGLWIGSAGSSQGGSSSSGCLAVVRGADGKLAGEAYATVEDARKRVEQ